MNDSDKRRRIRAPFNRTAAGMTLWVVSLLAVMPAQVRAQATDADAVERQVATYTQQIKKTPDRAELYIRRGKAYFKLHKFDRAVADFTEALRRDPHADEAYFGRGLASARDGFVEDGIRDLSTYLKRHPKSSRGYTKRGVRYLWLGDRVNAQKDLTRAVELDAKNAEAHDDLGVIFAQKRTYPTAEKHFRAAIHIDPTYQKAYHNLAMVLYLTGRDLEALTTVNSSLDLKPNARDSQLLKAEVLDSLGRHDEAQSLRNNAEFLPKGNWSEHAPVQ